MKPYFYLLIFLLLLSSCTSLQLYKEAKSEESIAKYETFITNYPKSKHISSAKEEVKKLYENRDWEITKNYNSIYAYSNFITKYPNSRHINEAKILKEAREEENQWELATKKNNIYYYQAFLNKYPNSKYQIDAEYNIMILQDKASWDSAEGEGSITAYENYLSEFPDGVYKNTAYNRINLLKEVLPKWNSIKNSTHPQKFRDFIQKYGQTIYANEARNKLNELENTTWQKAFNSKKLSYLNEYINLFPEGKHVDEARKLIIDIEVEDVFKGQYGQLPPMNKMSRNKGSYNEIEVVNNTSFTLTVLYSSQIDSKR